MSESLLGVILATSSSRGHHIVFRWPNNPKLFKRYSKVKYYTESRPSHSNRAHLEDELDPVRQKARWDHHDEDQDENGNIDSDDAGQSDTPSSSDVDESDGSMPDDDDNRSARDRAETVASHDRSKTGAARSASRSKSKSRRPLLSMEEASPSVRSTDRQTGALKEAPDANDRAPDSEAGTSKELSPEEKARREEKAARAYKTYLGYDIDILASILNPRPELSHKKFELVIDDLAFLGHPVTPNKNGVWGDQDDESQDDRVEARDEKTAAHAQQRGRSGLRKEIRPYDPSDDRVASNDKIDKSAKTGAKSRNASLTRIEQTNDIPTSRSKAPLTQFHLVLILDRPDPSTAVPGVDLSSWLQLFYDNIVFKMTAALFAEQSKSDYVGRETEKLLALRERCMDDGQAYAAYAAQCLGISSLARCIRDLHKSISISSDAFLTINDRIEVHLQLPPILQDPSSLAKTVDIETELDPNDPIFLSGGGFEGLGKEGAHQDGSGGTYKRPMAMTPAQLSFEEWCRTTGPYLLPWKTLLLLHDQVDEAPNRERAKSDTCSPAGLASPGEGASQALEAHGFDQLARKFTSFFTPSLYNTPNFSQVADMLGWDLYDDVYPMVRHLIYYRQARVIDVPRPGHVYAISPLFDFARLGSLSYNWAQTFPDVAPLPVFLSQLSSSTSRTLSNLFPARHQRELALEVLIWLLRHEVVVKMHIRLRLIATESVKRRTAERRVERQERHRARKEKKRQRAAELEARRMRKSQSEEQQRRRAAEQAEQAKQADEQQAQGHQRLTEERGRSRDRERSSSGEARQLGSSERKEQDDDAAGRVDAAEGDVQTSGLSVSRPPILADPDSVAQASAIAAAVVGSGGEVRRSGDHEHERQHHHHHHHQHAPQHRHHHRRHQNTSDPITGTDSTAAPSDKAPIPIAPRSQFDELKFERRPVLRSRSPSTAMAAGASAGLSVSFSNLSERGEITRRARADTTGSSSSGGGLRHSRTRGDAISMTPTTSQHSRPSTPNVVGRIIPSHVRDRSIGGGGSNVSSSAEGGSVPRRARRTTSSAGWGGRRGIPRSRSPSRARMRVKGFGADAEVEIDDDDDDGDEREEEVEEVMAMDEDVEQQDCGANELASELDLLCLDKGGKSERKKRRISSASERPELPPPSESHGSEGRNKSRSEGVLSSSCSTSSSGVTTLSELSLSSDLDSEAVDSNLDSNVHESQYGQTHRPSPLSSTSISPTSPTHTHRFGNHSRISTHSRATHAHTPRGSAYSDSLIVEPARASRRENEYIATMVENKDATTTKLFFRLLPYLNGKHTIDEIEYRVLMRRRHIRRLLKTFRESIITFMHP